MPIWVMEKQDPSQAVYPLVEDEEESETDFDNLESVAGRLLDIRRSSHPRRSAATRSVYFSTRAVASSSHAAMKATPPRGVIAPSQRVPVRLKR